MGSTCRDVVRHLFALRFYGRSLRRYAGAGRQAELPEHGLCTGEKSTAGDALRERSEELFRLYYFALIAYFRPLLSVSRKKDVGFEEFYAFDSTTVTLFSDVMKGVGRNPKDDGKKKGGLKVHMLNDVHADTAVFATISEAKMHDKKFLSHLNPSKGSMPVFDKAYNFYCLFSDRTKEGVNFVCRLKDNAKSQLQEVLFEKELKKEESGVYKIEHIHLDYKRGKKKETLCLRLVYYKDEKGRKYKFITNNWEIRPEEVALIYKYRWTIELTFKKTETKLSTALLLLGNGKRDKDTGLVHADCPFAVKRSAGLVRGAKRRFQPSRHWCGYT